jgi:hypothetical protein
MCFVGEVYPRRYRWFQHKFNFGAVHLSELKSVSRLGSGHCGGDYGARSDGY